MAGKGRKRGTRRPARRGVPEATALRGRFAEGVHPALDAVNRSLPVDRRLWREDLRASMAHARMLGTCGVLPPKAAARIVRGLRRIAREFEEGRFQERPGDEDVHMAVERRLVELIGADGARLHTARSRNDQVATDLKLHLVGASGAAVAGVREAQRALVALARRDGKAVLPYYTHLQRAQPVLLGHWLLAYVEMLERDREGLVYEPRECPLGSAAGAGTSFPIDRHRTARELGFARPSPNSIEAVSSRQEAARFAAGLAAAATTLSRLGADLVLWSSREFGFVRLGDSVSTGSSIMPQKRNPDGAELLRAQATRVHGAAWRLQEIQRGLPLGYFKDLQEDKAALFEAEDTLAAMLAVAVAMLGDLSFDLVRMRAAAEDPAGFLLATEAADHLARQGVPFREAHAAVGRLVREAEARGVGLSDLPPEALAAVHPLLGPDVRRVLTVDGALAARRALGGPAPANVAREIRAWERRLGRVEPGRGSRAGRASRRGSAG
jgi:argininosuccinate lyase